MYIDKLDCIVNEYNNIYHRIIKKKPIDVKSIRFINFGVEKNDRDPKFEVAGRVTKYKKKFCKKLHSKFV